MWQLLLNGIFNKKEAFEMRPRQPKKKGRMGMIAGAAGKGVKGIKPLKQLADASAMGKPGKTARRGWRVRPMRIKLPKYEMPNDKRLFKLDVEIGRNLLELPDALSEKQIMKIFGVDFGVFTARAKKIAPILKAAQLRGVVHLLVAMGQERAARRR